MSLRERMNNLLNIFNDFLSVIELAKAECLPPVLHVSNIALLMYPDSIKNQELLTFTLKNLVNQHKLPAITVEEFKQLIADHESQRDTSEYADTKAEGKLPAITLNAVSHADSDLLPDDVMVNLDEQLMYVVHRKDMKEWLEGENDWPLPHDNLLSRWWPEGTPKGNTMPLPINELESSTADNATKKVIKSTPSKKVAVENVFRKEGQIWTLSYMGTEVHLKNLKGMSYISYLLGSPNQEYHVTVLTKALEYTDDTHNELLSFSPSVVSTKETIADYRERLRQLKIDLVDAQRNGEELIVKDIMQEKEAIEIELKQSLGLGGRIKNAPDQVKKQANAVSLAIRRAIEVIYNSHPNLGRHLSNTINRGQYLSYNPGTDISWATGQ
jgi:hypothetical protein